MMKTFLAEHIIPGKVYLLDETPVTFHCTEDTGWLRGHLRISDFRTTGAGYMATGYLKHLTLPNNISDKPFDVIRKKPNEPWVLGLKRLQECSPEWLEKQIRVIKHRIDDANVLLDNLVDIQKKMST